MPPTGALTVLTVPSSCLIVNVGSTASVATLRLTVIPGRSSLISYPGHTVPNHATARLSPAGAVSLYSQSGTHLVADVFGYYQS